ncbi:hypothetical protein [Vreelandella venusta]|uniref:Uncharacterized protein n=1 Tax=Vreelandella venusta TaxID=44935 RepID=A0AAP9ZDZ4_9GAMM|nr:hypothetical protein [Halomonas venusta]EGP19939.1 hypothetical protein GME_08754 [Halomonas sp. TD01]MDW0358865.1 hypothetical protein [Halomonas venusta]QPI63750.1 hypothetical protein IR195_18195 [Halomonas venusta]QRL02943.1 hypothetical protein JDS37_16940 [Halomonas venusta]UQI42893.1 hypothetical protein M3L73_18785 [Halomonas venusta]
MEVVLNQDENATGGVDWFVIRASKLDLVLLAPRKQQLGRFAAIAL